MPEIRNIGIFAHVDAGKTTLSEQLLYHAGRLRTVGSVDRGTAYTDSMDVEKRRGISVRASVVSLDWKGTRVNLIDTPGHIDFSAEVERSFWALDGAVLLLDAAEGIQPQTEILFHALTEQGLPFLFFLNKTDRPGADVNRTLAQIRKRLTEAAFLLQHEDETKEYICGTDEALTERYLNDEPVDKAEIASRLRLLSRKGDIHPVLYGSALKNEHIDELLDAVTELLPPPVPGDAGLCGVVFAASADRTMGRGLWVRLFGGRLENRQTLDTAAGTDPVTGEQRFVQRKITQIRNASGDDTGILNAGETGVVYGLGDLRIGHVFGRADALPRHVEPGHYRTPLITVRVLPEKDEDTEKLRAACEELTLEDSLLNLEYIRSLKEIRLHVMGRIQLEILGELLKTRFGLNARFGEPAVIYRETVARETVGFVAYTMPKPCWAVLEFRMEPAPRGSGISFSSIVPHREIETRYQHQVRQALPLALSQGRKGWPVTDVKITLTGGSHHLIHTHPLDFIVATPMAIQDGLHRAGTVLLEPVLETRLIIPAECLGRIMTDINRMRGEIISTETDGENVRLTASVPAAESLDYATQLAAATGGRGVMNTRLTGYREAPPDTNKTAPRRGTDPLDTAKYILAARSALEGGIFDF
ncbi:MAG: TetM/TetW/TetO/TetS family tetracycline resistance ribosomal protection protein [Clostridia bacterium]|nr:TetM/TetW/TetO/TetS family tetracycline resistance ribosomal protection protein [Clostridia bacterium]